MTNLLNPFSVGAPRAAHDILTNLVAWWDYEENSTGTQFLDSHGSNHLDLINSKQTQNDSNATGRVGRASEWPNVSSSDGGQIPRSNATFDKGDVGFSFGAWFLFNQQIGINLTRFLKGRIGGTGAGQLAYAIQYPDLSPNFNFSFFARNAADSASTAFTHTGVSTNTGVWYFVVFCHDPVNDLIIGYVNTSKQSTAFSGGPFQAGTANFSVAQGRRSDTTNWDITRTIGHRQDSGFFLDRVITDGEVAYLYNAGAGKNYSQLVADAA